MDNPIKLLNLILIMAIFLLPGCVSNGPLVDLGNPSPSGVSNANQDRDPVYVGADPKPYSKAKSETRYFFECKKMIESSPEELIEIKSEDSQRICRLRTDEHDPIWMPCDSAKKKLHQEKQICQQEVKDHCQLVKEEINRRKIIVQNSDESPKLCKLGHWPEYWEPCARIFKYLKELHRVCKKLDGNGHSNDPEISQACPDSSIDRLEEPFGDFVTIRCRLDDWEENLWSNCSWFEQVCQENPGADSEEIKSILQRLGQLEYR